MVPLSEDILNSRPIEEIRPECCIIDIPDVNFSDDSEDEADEVKEEKEKKQIN